jgi:serine/threonine protein kinase
VICASELNLTCLRNEIEVMRYLDHPSIIKLYRIYEDKGVVSLVMSLAGADLRQVINQHGKYTEYEAALLMQNLLHAIAYLHTLNIIHRDIKLDNILMKSLKPNGEGNKHEIYLCDFGLAEACE